MIRVIRDKLREEIIFLIATLLAIITGFFAPTRIEAINGSVIMALFNLMLITLALEKYHLLDFIMHFKPLIHKKKILFYILLFILVVLSILRVLPEIFITALVLLVFLIKQPKLIKKVDYYLLGTFVAFFIFIDHMTHIPFFVEKIPALLSTPGHTFVISAIASQVISNVPAAILFSGFTLEYKALLVGVSVGGIGTMIASLANLIALKIYQKSYAIAPFKRYFYLMNISLLGIFLGLFLIVFNKL